MKSGPDQIRKEKNNGPWLSKPAAVGMGGSSVRAPVLTVLSVRTFPHAKHLSYLSVGPYLSALSIGQTQSGQIICCPLEGPFGSGRGCYLGGMPGQWVQTKTSQQAGREGPPRRMKLSVPWAITEDHQRPRVC